MYDTLIVGAGFAGSVLAERLAAGLGQKVLLIDRRGHIGGNAYDEYNADGLLVHRYGPHIFHTNATRVWDYLSQFTTWRPYEHRVRASVDGQLVPIPINLDTINALYGLSLTSFEVEAFFRSVAQPREAIRTSEDVVVSVVGERALPKVFPRLHAEAVGPRPVRARRQRDSARPDADEPGRPLLHRYLPGDAGAGLHPDVRSDAGPPQHPRAPQRRLPRCPRRGGLPPARLHRPGRRVLRLPVRETPLSLAPLRPRNSRSRDVPAGAGRELPERAPLHPHHRVQVPHGAGAPEDGRRLPSTRAPRATRTTRSRGRRTPSCTGSTRRSPRPRPASTSSGGWPRTSTTTWTR